MSDTPDDETINLCVDINLCLALSHGKRSLAADILALLLRELPPERTKINRALDEYRFADARELIHKLHGACCYCGVPALKNICKKLEQQLDENLQAPSSTDRHAFNEAVDALLIWETQYDVGDLFA